MKFVPLNDLEMQSMLEAIGVEKVDDLFQTVPEDLRLNEILHLPPPHSEMELIREFRRAAERNNSCAELRSFLGAGCYQHVLPAVVEHLASRPEFSTAYTPYQPEISQGTLQAIFEFQTLIAQLTGMEIANASLYDGASALAEGVLMAHRLNGGRRVLISSGVHPEYRQVAQTYLRHVELDVDLIVIDPTEGTTDVAKLERQISDDVSAIVVQYPNFLGVIEPLDAMQQLVENHPCQWIVVICEALALGLLTPPGEFGADIVLGEAQSFGNPMNFGGPHLGFLATREALKRQVPGRLVGETVDREGERGYVLTLATREQHIRRSKATSNICTNHSLCALRATIFLASLGEKGLRALALQNHKKTEYLKSKIVEIPGVELLFQGQTFNEFAMKTSEPFPVETCRRRGIVPGFDLSSIYPDLQGSRLICVTELLEKEDLDQFADLLREAPG